MKFLQIIAAGVAMTQTNAFDIGKLDRKALRDESSAAFDDLRASLTDLANEFGLF